MRKTKIVEPQRTAATTFRWKCPSCQAWVNEAIGMRCADCTAGVSKAPKTKAPPAPKMFSDLGDMFGTDVPRKAKS
jgi:hypothetical protein